MSGFLSVCMQDLLHCCKPEMRKIRYLHCGQRRNAFRCPLFKTLQRNFSDRLKKERFFRLQLRTLLYSKLQERLQLYPTAKAQKFNKFNKEYAAQAHSFAALKDQ